MTTPSSKKKERDAFPHEIVATIAEGIGWVMAGVVILLVLLWYFHSGMFATMLVPLLCALFGLSKIRSSIVRLRGDHPVHTTLDAAIAHQRISTDMTDTFTPSEEESLPSPPAAEERREQPVRTVAPARASVEIDWEEWVGKKLLQKAGIIVVLVGMVVLLKWSFDNRIIGELGRIGLGFLGACCLLGAGEWFSRSYRQWAQGFTGGGIALLYFTVWVADVYYADALREMHGIGLSFAAAMFLYACITLIASVVAIRYTSQPIAWFALIGGYATPLLLGGNATPLTMVAYLLLLTSGMLALAWHARWRYLNLGAFTLTQIHLISLYLLPVTVFTNTQQIVVAAAFFLLFCFLPFLYQFRLGQSAEPDDVLLVIANAGMGLLAVIGALEGGFSSTYAPYVCVAFAAAESVFAAMTLLRRSEDHRLLSVFFSLAVGFVALALFLEMEPRWVMAGWAPFSALLAGSALLLKRRVPFVCATVLLLGALFFLAIDAPLRFPEEWRPFLSPWAIKNYIVLASLLAWIAVHRQMADVLAMPSDTRIGLSYALHTLIALLLFTAVTFEATQLDFRPTALLTLSYLLFASGALALFLFTGTIVWFAAAFSVQVIVLMFIFFLGDGSWMVWGRGMPDEMLLMPFFHPWGYLSMLSLFLTAGMAYTIVRSANVAMNTVNTRTLFIGAALAQVWVHVTVELIHMQQRFGWSVPLGERIVSAWWIIFALAVLVAGIYFRDRIRLRYAALLLLLPPFMKDLWLLLQPARGFGENDLFYITALWSVLPIFISWIGARLRLPELVQGGLAYLGAMAGFDMLLHIREEAGGLLRTTWWALSALVVMIGGFVERSQAMRRVAIGIFGASTFKLLIFDLAIIESVPVRIGASICTGLLLIGASYLYQRFDDVFSRRS